MLTKIFLISLIAFNANAKAKSTLYSDYFTSADITQYEKKELDLLKDRFENLGRAPSSKTCELVPTGNLDTSFQLLDGERSSWRELYSQYPGKKAWVHKINIQRVSPTVRTVEYLFKEINQNDNQVKKYSINSYGSVSRLYDTSFAAITTFGLASSAAPNPSMTIKTDIVNMENGNLAGQFHCSDIPTELNSGAIANNNSFFPRSNIGYKDGKWRPYCLVKHATDNQIKEAIWDPKTPTRKIVYDVTQHSKSLFINDLSTWLLIGYDNNTKTVEVKEIQDKDDHFEFGPALKYTITGAKLEGVDFVVQNYNRGLIGIALKSDYGVFNLFYDHKVKSFLPDPLLIKDSIENVSHSNNSQYLAVSTVNGIKLFQRFNDGKYQEINTQATLQSGLDPTLSNNQDEQQITKYYGARFVNGHQFIAKPFSTSSDNPSQATSNARLRLYTIQNSTLTYQPIKGSDKIQNISLAEASDEIILSMINGRKRILDINTAKVRPATTLNMLARNTPIGGDYFTDSNFTNEVINPKLACIRWDDVKVINKTDTLANNALNSKDGFCRQKMRSNSIWHKLTLATTDKPEISIAALDAFKLRIQKKNGLDLNRDLKTLLYLFDQGRFAQNQPLDAARALTNVLSQSQMLYQYILVKFVGINNSAIRDNPPNAQTCWSTIERQEFNTVATSFMDRIFLDSRFNDAIKIDAEIFNKITPLRQALQPKDKKTAEALVDTYAQRLAENSKSDPFLSKMFMSKLYKFAYQFIAPLFNETPHQKIDYTILTLSSSDSIKDSKTNEVVPTPSLHSFILATNPFSTNSAQAIRSGYGFYFLRTGFTVLEKNNAKNTVPVKITPEMKETQIRLNNGQTFKVTLSADYLVQGDIITKDKAFPIQKAISSGPDKSLSGLLMFGTGLGDEEYVHDEYVSFFKKLGYQFNTPVEVADLRPWIKELISSNRLDYLIKEAHSDGDEKNVFRFNIRAKMTHGKKSNQDIYLTLPIKESSNKPNPTHLLSNQEFGTWIRGRSLPFTYLNTSCWSVSKAPWEIQEARTPLFLDIASTTANDTFYDAPDSAMYQLISALIKGETFTNTREKYLTKNKEYQNKSDNHYIFPDQEEYENEIVKKLQIPISTKLAVYDSKGVEVKIDE